MIRAYHPTEPAASKSPSDSYYMDQSRGGGVRTWRNDFAVMGWEAWLGFDPVAKASKVKVPTLMVHSEKAAFPKQAEKVFGLLAGPKESVWINEKTHFEFYDDRDTVLKVVERIAEFLHRNVKEE